MKNTLYTPSKMVRIIFTALLLNLTGMFPMLHATETDPTPSKSVGGRTVVINNTTKYTIAIKDLVMRNPHHDDRGKTNDLGKTIPPRTEMVFGPIDGCNAGMIGTWTNSCFWGAPNKSGEFKISVMDNGKAVTDPNKSPEIKISKGKGVIALDLEERNAEGYCFYTALLWEAIWKGKYYEITFKEENRRTGRQDPTCRK